MCINLMQVDPSCGEVALAHMQSTFSHLFRIPCTTTSFHQLQTDPSIHLGRTAVLFIFQHSCPSADENLDFLHITALIPTLLDFYCKLALHSDGAGAFIMIGLACMLMRTSTLLIVSKLHGKRPWRAQKGVHSV